MKSTLVLLALAGLATTASAGPSESFSLSIGDEPVRVDSLATFSIDIYGDSSFGNWMLGGEFGLSTGENPMVTNIAWRPAAWSIFNTDYGYAGNGDYNSVIFGQFVLLPAFTASAGSELGGYIGSFEISVDDTSGRMLSRLDLSLVVTNRFALMTIADNGEMLTSDEGILTMGEATVFVGIIPAPSALVFLGFGGLATSRRRR